MQILLWVAALLLLSAALSMGVIAWRTARGVRERESALAELLRALALSDASAAPASGPSISDWTAEFLSEEGTAPAVDTHELAASIFGERARPVTALPRWISLFGVSAAMALGLTFYVVLAGGPKGARATTTAAPMAPATVSARTTAVPNRPIELIALQYRLGSATDFEVSGLVRNPPDGRELPQLVAVVNLLDADGRLLASQVSPVERPVLEAGQTSAFSLAFPHVSGTTARYQVQFRLDGRGTVPHVDRRAPDSRTAAKEPSS